MSQASLPPSVRTHTRDPTDTIVVDDDERVETILDTLDDGDCRCILEATDDDALSASEIADACDLPLSTTYRKLEPLTETGLVSKGLRISTSGKHTAEYERALGDVMISVSPSGLEVRLTRRSADEERRAVA